MTVKTWPWSDIKRRTIVTSRRRLIEVVGQALYGWGKDEPNEATGFTARHEVETVADAILAAFERADR